MCENGASVSAMVLDAAQLNHAHLCRTVDYPTTKHGLFCSAVFYVVFFNGRYFMHGVDSVT